MARLVAAVAMAVLRAAAFGIGVPFVLAFAVPFGWGFVAVRPLVRVVAVDERPVFVAVAAVGVDFGKAGAS